VVYGKPLPVITSLNKPYWDSARQHKLRLQRCASCGRWVYPITTLCPYCWSEKLSWDLVSGTGTISSWVVYHRALDESFADDVPYAVIQVDLDEYGVRLISNLIGTDLVEIKFGMRVEVEYDDITQEITLVKFKGAGTGRTSKVTPAP
jgi:uncharacterized OB-fold protein